MLTTLHSWFSRGEPLPLPPAGGVSSSNGGADSDSHSYAQQQQPPPPPEPAPRRWWHSEQRASRLIFSFGGANLEAGHEERDALIVGDRDAIFGSCCQDVQSSGRSLLCTFAASLQKPYERADASLVRDQLLVVSCCSKTP